MGFKSAYSTHMNPSDAARELASALALRDPKLLVFFASPALVPEELGAALRREFGAVPSIGCTSSGEIAAGRMLKKSVVAAAFDEELIDSVAVAEVREMSSAESVDAALTELARAFRCAPSELDPDALVGIALHDGLSTREEDVMSALSARTNLRFVGGSAGDDLAFQATHVFKNFVPARGCSVLAVLKPKGKFSILKTQSFDVLSQTLVVTSCDEKTRTVHTFNGKPAAEEYARAVGVSVQELPNRFQSNPLGLVLLGGEPYVRSPQRIEGTGVVFYCKIAQGAVLSVLRSRNLVEDTRRDFERAVAELGSLGAAINFDCILRTLELERQNQSEAYGKLFEGKPAVGFSTYGESYIGHINQTSTMLLFA